MPFDFAFEDFPFGPAIALTAFHAAGVSHQPVGECAAVVLLRAALPLRSRPARLLQYRFEVGPGHLDARPIRPPALVREALLGLPVPCVPCPHSDLQFLSLRQFEGDFLELSPSLRREFYSFESRLFAFDFPPFSLWRPPTKPIEQPSEYIFCFLFSLVFLIVRHPVFFMI